MMGGCENHGKSRDMILMCCFASAALQDGGSWQLQLPMHCSYRARRLNIQGPRPLLAPEPASRYIRTIRGTEDRGEDEGDEGEASKANNLDTLRKSL